MRHLLKLACGALPLDLQRLFCDLVLVQPAGVPPPPQQQCCVRLLCLDNLLFDLQVYGRLLCAHESRAHVDAAGTETERRGKSPTVGETTAGDKGNLQGLAGLAEEDEIGNVALADVAGAFETVDAEEVDAELNGALGMSNTCTLVKNDHTSLLELRDDRSGRVTRRLHDLDALIDNSLSVCAVVRGDHSGEKSDIHAEGVLSEGSAALDFFAQGGGRGEDESGDDTETAGVGDG